MELAASPAVGFAKHERTQLSRHAAAGRSGRNWATWARRIVLLAWPVVVTASFTWRTARYGFNPTDQYYILADSWRILHGQVPHADFVTARPAGSPIYHMVDFLLAGGYRGPVFMVGTLLSVLEVFVAAIALLALVTRTPYGRWCARSWPQARNWPGRATTWSCSRPTTLPASPSLPRPRPHCPRRLRETPLRIYLPRCATN